MELDAVAGFVFIGDAGAGSVEYTGFAVFTRNDYEHLLTVSFAVHPVLAPSKTVLTRGAVGRYRLGGGHRLGGCFN